MNRTRWWAACAFGRTPLARTADRVEAWALVAGFLLLIVAVYPSLALGRMDYAARTQAIAADAATRHLVQATALEDSTAQPSQDESSSTTFLVNARWSAKNISHEAMTKVEQPVKAGGRVEVWLNDEGKVTTPPSTDSDARIEAIGVVALVWFLFAAVVAGSLAALRNRLRRTRHREWDRGLWELVDNGGGSATHRP